MTGAPVEKETRSGHEFKSTEALVTWRGPLWPSCLMTSYFTQDRGKNAHSMPAAKLPAFHFAIMY